MRLAPIRFRISAMIFALMLAFLIVLPAESAPPDATFTKPFPHPKGYVCYRTDKPITIDGALNDAAWDAAPWTDTFVDIEGDAKPKPRFRTRVKMLWDDEALYIAAEMEEPHVWATLTNHDSVIYRDNDFEVFIDPDGDNHNYAELEMNALNTTWDLLLTKPYKDGGRALNAWEATGLKTAVKIDGTLNDPRDKDTGWTLEIRWPWTSLTEIAPRAQPPTDREQWRVNFSRVQWDREVVDGKYRKADGKREHNWVWSPQGSINMHCPERWGYIQFSNAKPGQTEFRPDADWECRDLLHRAYYAQYSQYFEKRKYFTSTADLGLKEAEAKRITLETTRSGFEASVALPADKDGKARRMVIREDARIRKE